MGSAYRWKTKTTYQTTTTTVPNPTYTTLVSDAQAFYKLQPPPYNSGVRGDEPKAEGYEG